MHNTSGIKRIVSYSDEDYKEKLSCRIQSYKNEMNG